MTNRWQAPEVLLGQERPTMFADIWSVAATLLQWLTEQSSPWNMQDLCTRYKMRHNREIAALMKVINKSAILLQLYLILDFDNGHNFNNIKTVFIGDGK